MTIRSNIRIYKTCVRPIMTYAIDTRAENTITKSLVRTTEIRNLKSITGYTLYDHKRSEEIRKTCEIQDVVRWACK